MVSFIMTKNTAHFIKQFVYFVLFFQFCILQLDRLLTEGKKEKTVFMQPTWYAITFFQGVKLSLSTTPVGVVSSLDYDLLKLVWTQEKLEKHIDIIDQNWERCIHFWYLLLTWIFVLYCTSNDSWCSPAWTIESDCEIKQSGSVPACSAQRICLCLPAKIQTW